MVAGWRLELVVTCPPEIGPEGMLFLDRIEGGFDVEETTHSRADHVNSFCEDFANTPQECLGRTVVERRHDMDGSVLHIDICDSNAERALRFTQRPVDAARLSSVWEDALAVRFCVDTVKAAPMVIGDDVHRGLPP
jgi:hypothetical protein